MKGSLGTIPLIYNLRLKWFETYILRQLLWLIGGVQPPISLKSIDKHNKQEP